MFAVAVALVAVSQVAVAVTDRDLDILAAYVKLKPNAFFFALLRSLSSVPVLYLACLQLACPDARTLNSHLQETEAPIAMYTGELTVDLAEWGVQPSDVSIVLEHPLFLWLRLLPVPQPRENGESDEAYLERLGPCPVDVRWDYTPMTNRGGGKVIDGCASCGELWRHAMETTPAGSYPAMINISLDGVSLNTHAAEKSCCPVKVGGWFEFGFQRCRCRWFWFLRFQFQGLRFHRLRFQVRCSEGALSSCRGRVTCSGRKLEHAPFAGPVLRVPARDQVHQRQQGGQATGEEGGERGAPQAPGRGTGPILRLR